MSFMRYTKNEMYKAITKDTFDEEVLRSEEPVLVDFWAKWCGPCQTVAPVLDQIVAERGLRLVKVDVDTEMSLARRFGVMSIPVTMLFRAGRPDKIVTGAYPKAELERLLGLN